MKNSESALSIIGNGCWHSIGTWGDRSCEKLEKASICNSCPIYLEAGQAVLSREVAAPHFSEHAQVQPIPDEDFVVGESIVDVVVAGNRIGIPSHYVVQIVLPQQIQRIPETRIDSGLVSIDGEIHLWVSGRAFFDLSGNVKDDASQAKMVVLNYNGEKTILGVDAVVSVTKVSEKDQVVSPFTLTGEEKRWVRNTYLVKGELVTVVNLPLLLTTLEGRI